MLRTPSAIEGQGGAISEKQSRERNRMLQVRDQMAQLAFENGLKVPDSIASSLADASPGEMLPPRGLLPTPIVRDYKDSAAQVLRDGKVQVDTVGRAIMHSGEITLPTPTSNDYKSPNDSNRRTTSAKGLPAKIKQLPEDQNSTVSWGRFEPAIRRWEGILGRKAPAPTKPDGRDGNHRLSSSFVEWMMGLPKGWVTESGLNRNVELKICGNGVVPQQAELALRLLLGKVKENTK
jgi:hypothetical protein